MQRHCELRSILPSLMLAVLGLALFMAAPGVLSAQEEETELRLRLRRDFGYGSGLNIQGRFSMIVDGNEALERVVFFVDDQQIGEDSEAPFRLQFNTSGYELGWHALHAVGYTADGRELETNGLQRQFVSANTGTIVVVAIVALVIGFRVISHFVTRNKMPGKEQGYGMYGGAICPRCGRPFSRHWWAPNLLVGKLDRCPHCGKWHFATRATPQMLESAERFAEELDEEERIEMPAPDEQESLKRRLDESRFDE